MTDNSQTKTHAQSVGMRDEDAIIFWYRNYKGEEGYRRVIPISLRYGRTEWHPEDQWLLLGYDTEKKAEREFALADAKNTVGPTKTAFVAAQPPAAPVETDDGARNAHSTLWGQIAAIYGELDAEDCAWIDREWAKMRGYILPTDGTSTLSRSSAGTGGARMALDQLADKVSAKIAQLQHYRDNDCQLDHAKTIAEGRLQQANQILHWIAEAAVTHPTTEPQAASEPTDEMVTAAMRAFEPMSSVLRYREKDKWHSCDIMAMRDALKAALALPRPHGGDNG